MLQVIVLSPSLFIFVFYGIALGAFFNCMYAIYALDAQGANGLEPSSSSARKSGVRTFFLFLCNRTFKYIFPDRNPTKLSVIIEIQSPWNPSSEEPEK